MLHSVLWEANQDLARGCLAHPFVQGLRDGTLPEDTFKRYVAQDAFFLDAFARAYALALARSEDAETIAAFHRLIGGVLDELRLHATYAMELNIDLTNVEPNPACQAYTDFLLATAWQQPQGEILAAMTPCMRLYAYLGDEIRQGIGGRDATASHRYGRWIATYSDPELKKLADFVDELLDRHAEDTPAVRSAYRYAMQCELDFFSDACEGPVRTAGGAR